MHFYFDNKKICSETMKSISLIFLVLLISISKLVVLFLFSCRPLASGRKHLGCLNLLQYLMVPHIQDNVLLYHRSFIVLTGFEFH